MEYKEFKLNIARAGLTIKEFAELIGSHPTSITNLKQKAKVPKKLAIISILIVELFNNGVDVKGLLEKSKITWQIIVILDIIFISNSRKGFLMNVHRKSIEVFVGDEHDIVVDGECKKDNFCWVVFYQEEHIYRHKKTFETFKEAYAFMLKIWGSANAGGVVTLNPVHWCVFEHEIAC